MIVKIQRNLVGPSSILIYDKPIESMEDGMITDTHKIFAQHPMSTQEITALLGEDLKGHFEAEIEGDGILIGKRIPDQGW